jgi:excisionase family DNA binding protein
VTNVGIAIVDALDDEALARLADRLAPLIAERMDREGVGRLLSAKEVGERLGLHERTVSRMAAEGRLEGRKVGRGWKFDPARLTVAPRTPRDLGPTPAARPRRRVESATAAVIRGITPTHTPDRSR